MPAIRTTVRAREDLLDIWLHIAHEDVAAADRVFDRLQARIQVLAQFPEVGPPRSEIAPDARMLIVRPYLVLYRITGGFVQIVRVVHGARQIDSATFDAGRG